MYDVIGDIHGYADELEALLRGLGYEQRNGTYQHPTRTAVFVGDLIDRHPEGQLRTIDIVRRMVDAGSAKIVLGNHEFNAVAYATEHPSGGYCRAHNEKNLKQHQAFLDAVEFGSSLHRELLNWFMTIPLWLDLGELRIAHACWSTPDIAHLAPLTNTSGGLTEQLVIDGSTKGTATYEAIERILKGPEVTMNGYTYLDKGGIKRSKARARWWDSTIRTLRDAAHVPGDADLISPDGELVPFLPDEPLTPGAVPRYDDDIPVVVGHYWESGDFELLSPTVACVDYSVAGGGPLVAYRWNTGDEQLDTSQFFGT